jgi:hypothetical protein
MSEGDFQSRYQQITLTTILNLATLEEMDEDLS